MRGLSVYGWKHFRTYVRVGVVVCPLFQPTPSVFCRVLGFVEESMDGENEINPGDATC